MVPNLPAVYPNYPWLLAATLLFLLHSPLAAQDAAFAPIGARWVYPYYLPNTPYDGYAGVTLFTATRDTLLDGRQGRVITRSSVLRDGSRATAGEAIVASAGDTVFLHQNASWRVLFDYSAAAGDTIRVMEQPFTAPFEDGEVYELNYFTYRVDSVGVRPAGTDSLRVQYVSYVLDPGDTLLQWGFQDILDRMEEIPGQILEGVGSLGRQTPLGASNDISYLIGGEPERLACYDDALRSYRFGGIDCDSLIASFELPNAVAEPAPAHLSVYPNPFRHEIHVANTGGPPVTQVEIRDVAGRLVYAGASGDTVTDLPPLAPGPYFAILTDAAGRRYVVRITKE